MRSTNWIAVIAACGLLAACESEQARGQARQAGVASASGIDAVEAVAWKADLDAAWAPFRAEGTLWVVAKGKLVAVSEADGAAQQRIDLGAEPTSPVVVADDAAYFADERTVRAVALEGGQIWSKKLAGATRGALVLSGDTLFVAAGQLYALDPKTGEQRWKFDAEATIYATPSVDGDLVYVTDSMGKLYAIDAKSGQQTWVYDAREPFAAVGITLTPELAIAPTEKGAVVAVFRHTGREKWRFATGDAITSAVAAVGDDAYVGTEAGAVFAINTRTGQQRWAREELAAVVTQPIFADGVVHVGSDDGTLTALAADSGETRWSHKLESEPLGVPVIGNGEVFVADADGNVYGLE